MWVEPDCNLPSGESFCRQLLTGQRFFQQEFGRTAAVGYNVDSFGHTAGLPQLLRSAGLTSYIFMRPNQSERGLPSQLFRWRDLSGADLLAYRIPFAYETNSPEDLAPRLQQGNELAIAEQSPLMLFIGVGNHGGGPTTATLAEIDRLRPDYRGLRYSDPGRYFADVTQAGQGACAPVVTGELQHHAVGCYSVSAWTKAGHDAAEAALLDAEGTELVASWLTGRAARQPELTEAWTELLLFQFHDVLAGSASSRAYQSMRARLGHVQTVADRITTNALYQLAHRIDTRKDLTSPVERHSSFWTGNEGKGVPYLVYNPLPWAVRQAVVGSRSADEVLDSSGQAVPHQAIASGEVTLFPSHPLFFAELPPLGYEVFWLRGARRSPADASRMPAMTMESDFIRAAVDPRSGAIVSIYHQTSQRELVGTDGIRLILQRDTSDTWSHGVARYAVDQLSGTFDGCQLVESGPVRWTIRLRFSFGSSLVTEEVSLLACELYAQVRLRADWREPQVVLKLLLPGGSARRCRPPRARLMVSRSGCPPVMKNRCSAGWTATTRRRMLASV